MQVYKVLIFIFLNFSFSYCLQVKAFVDKNKCSIDDIINYKIELEDADSFGEVNIEKISKYFSIISGPSQQTSMQWINGSVTNSRIMSWSIAPKESGKLIIPALSVIVGSRKLKTNQIAIQVIGSNKKKSNLDVFISAEIDKDEAYLGEQITIIYKLYKKVEISLEPFQVPEFSGFWTEELYRPNQIKFKKVDLNGVRYDVGTLYKVAVFPISGTNHLIKPLVVKVQVQKKRSRRKRDPFFDPFFNSFFTETETKILRSPEREINIKKFPEPRPGGFTGAVGKFKISTSIDRDSTYVNEAITFRVNVDGTGNLGLFTLPKFKFSDQLDQFPPKENFKKNVFRDALSGSMSWDYILVPRISGKISIPPIVMTYFDPIKEKWQRISSRATNIPVIKSNTLAFDNNGLSKKEVKLLSKDINYIRTDNPQWIKNDDSSIRAILLYIASILLIPIPFIFNTFLGYRLSNKPSRISRNALSNAIKKINDPMQNILESSSKIIFSYLKDKLQLTSDNLDSIIAKDILYGLIDDNLLNDLVEHLKSCDSVYYSQQKDSKGTDFKEKTLNLLQEIDNQIK